MREQDPFTAFTLTADQQARITSRKMTPKDVQANLDKGLPPDFREYQDPVHIKAADDRNDAIAKLREAIVGDTVIDNKVAVTRDGYVALFGPGAIRADGRPVKGFEVDGVEVVCED